MSVGGISERRAFERLTRDGLRARSRTLWCRYVPDPDAVPPQLAFSIGRNVGTAVARNRLRRQLRAAVRALAGSPPLANGLLLVGAQPAAIEQSFDDLVAEVAGMLKTFVPTSSSTGQGAGE